MIVTFDHTTEGALTDLLNDLVAVSDLVACFEPVIAFLVIETVVNQAFQFRRKVLFFFGGYIPNFFKFFNFGLFICSKHFFRENGLDITAFAREL